ncbi:MAG: GDP-mannose 4,6-dehydratase [Candidatus Firestonebacteria bacterium]
MKCLVTGVAGFIGSHLTERLIKDGYKVTGIDKFTNYYSRKLKENNLKNLTASKKFVFIEGDILKLNLKKIVNDVDYIYHLAAQPGVRASWGDKFKIYINDNILATQVLLEEIKNNKKLKKIVFASSSSIYGDTKILPINEEVLPKPISPYGVTKLAAERLCYLYWKSHRVPVVSLRYFSVYGPWQRPDMAFNIFINNILSGKSLPIFDALSTRDFTYISDIVKGTILAAKSDFTGEVFNLGGGNRISLGEVIKKISSIMNITPKLDIKGSQKGDVKHTWANISKAKRLLGYKPSVDIDEGLVEEVKWLTKIRNDVL